jgi:DNA-binding NarL/FixJ family response regulator
MMEQDSCAWDDYAREQRAIRRRELREQTDVSGREAIDLILDAIAMGDTCSWDDARRSRLTAARHERAQVSLRKQYAPGIEADLLYRRGPDAEISALLSMVMTVLPDEASRVLTLQSQGYADHEIGVRVGISAAAVRQRLSRLGRKLAT